LAIRIARGLVPGLQRRITVWGSRLACPDAIVDELFQAVGSIATIQTIAKFST
jgi:hypothetical protein